MVTGAEAVDYGGGGSVIDDLGSVVEVVQVVTTIKAPKTKNMIQNQVLQRQERQMSRWTDSQTETERQTHLHLSLLLGDVVLLEFIRLRRCSTHRRPGGSIEPLITQSVNRRNIFFPKC